MPCPPLEAQAHEKPERGDRAACDEERLEDVGCDVGDVRDGLAGRHRDVVGATLCEPFYEEGEDCCEPGECGGEGHPDVGPVRVLASLLLLTSSMQFLVVEIWVSAGACVHEHRVG